ncbi:MAG: cell division protein FtsL [Nitrospinota bacterium]|nr:cell division protein FtsL [Nitrospinota bacterium]
MFDGAFRKMNGWFQVSPMEFRLVLGLSLLFMIGSMALVWSNVTMVKQAYDFRELKQENHDLVQVNQLLNLERDSLSSLYRVRTLAQKELGLRPIENHQVITVFLK